MIINDHQKVLYDSVTIFRYKKTTKGKCGKDCHQFCSFSCYISRGTFAWSLWYMYMTTLIAYFFKQLIVNNREMKRFSCTY